VEGDARKLWSAIEKAKRRDREDPAMRHLREETEGKISYNKWRREGEGEGGRTKDELAATIRL